MVYGGSLQKPVFIGLAGLSSANILIYDHSIQRPLDVSGLSIPDLDFFFPASKRQPGTDLGRRTFLNVALFWGGDIHENYVSNPGRLAELKAETANQHGRLYLPTETRPAVTVTTAGFVCAARPAPQRGSPVSIPSDISGFPCGRTLSDADLATLRRLGVPGF
jgi:hypothetical protein